MSYRNVNIDNNLSHPERKIQIVEGRQCLSCPHRRRDDPQFAMCFDASLKITTKNVVNYWTADKNGDPICLKQIDSTKLLEGIEVDQETIDAANDDNNGAVFAGGLTAEDPLAKPQPAPTGDIDDWAKEAGINFDLFDHPNTPYNLAKAEEEAAVADKNNRND